MKKRFYCEYGSVNNSNVDFSLAFSDNAGVVKMGRGGGRVLLNPFQKRSFSMLQWSNGTITERFLLMVFYTCLHLYATRTRVLHF